MASSGVRATVRDPTNPFTITNGPDVAGQAVVSSGDGITAAFGDAGAAALFEGDVVDLDPAAGIVYVLAPDLSPDRVACQPIDPSPSTAYQPAVTGDFVGFRGKSEGAGPDGAAGLDAALPAAREVGDLLVLGCQHDQAADLVVNDGDGSWTKVADGAMPPVDPRYDHLTVWVRRCDGTEVTVNLKSAGGHVGYSCAAYAGIGSILEVSAAGTQAGGEFDMPAVTATAAGQIVVYFCAAQVGATGPGALNFGVGVTRRTTPEHGTDSSAIADEVAAGAGAVTTHVTTTSGFVGDQWVGATLLLDAAPAPIPADHVLIGVTDDGNAVIGKLIDALPSPSGTSGAVDGIYVATLGTASLTPGDVATDLTFDETSLINIRGDGVTPVPSWASINVDGSLHLLAGIYQAMGFHRPGFTDVTDFYEFQLKLSPSLIAANLVTKQGAGDGWLTFPGMVGRSDDRDYLPSFLYVSGPAATYSIGNGDLWFQIVKLA